jgi:hypothetical protein
MIAGLSVRSKRGNGYLRMLFVQAARVVLLRPANWPKHSFGRWLEAAVKRAAALASKLTRIAWSVLHHGRGYEPRIRAEQRALVIAGRKEPQLPLLINV